MDTPFTDDLCQIADSMGISLYQRFSETEASLFLRCPVDKLREMRGRGSISFIAVDKVQAEYFGHQLLEYLLRSVVVKPAMPTVSSTPDRIIRAGEVQKITGLSRTTVWRLERRGEFPDRVPLGPGSVGWKLSEVERWISTRK